MTLRLEEFHVCNKLSIENYSHVSKNMKRKVSPNYIFCLGIYVDFHIFPDLWRKLTKQERSVGPDQGMFLPQSCMSTRFLALLSLSQNLKNAESFPAFKSKLNELNIVMQTFQKLYWL